MSAAFTTKNKWIEGGSLSPGYSREENNGHGCVFSLEVVKGTLASENKLLRASGNLERIFESKGSLECTFDSVMLRLTSSTKRLYTHCVQ